MAQPRPGLSMDPGLSVQGSIRARGEKWPETAATTALPHRDFAIINPAGDRRLRDRSEAEPDIREPQRGWEHDGDFDRLGTTGDFTGRAG